MNNIAAIPTVYNGVHFRSRLEARWAAFFDLLRWSWEYEPVDLTGYIPDFIVDLDSTSFLFEVKPMIRWPCAIKGCACGPGDAEERVLLDGAISKIEASGWKGRALVVGAVFAQRGQLGVPNLGIPVQVGDLHWSETGTVVVEASHPYGREYGLRHDAQPYFDDGRRAPLAGGLVPVDPTTLWREAGNRVQWKPGQPRARPRREENLPYGELAKAFRALSDELEGE